MDDVLIILLIYLSVAIWIGIIVGVVRLAKRIPSMLRDMDDNAKGLALAIIVKAALRLLLGG